MNRALPANQKALNPVSTKYTKGHERNQMPFLEKARPKAALDWFVRVISCRSWTKIKKTAPPANAGTAALGHLFNIQSIINSITGSNT
jgi:hypothetical protein